MTTKDDIRQIKHAYWLAVLLTLVSFIAYITTKDMLIGVLALMAFTMMMCLCCFLAFERRKEAKV